MSEQPELNFATRAEAAASRLPELLAVLRKRPGWRTARELEQEGFSDRVLRQIVEGDVEGEIFSYPGSPGYKVFTEVTVEEFAKADRLRSQAEAMTQRYLRYQRRYHRGRAR